MAGLREHLRTPGPRVAWGCLGVVLAGAVAQLAMAWPQEAADVAARFAPPLFVAAGLAIWRRRPGHVAGPGLVAYGLWEQLIFVLAATLEPWPFTVALFFVEWQTPLLIWAVLAFPSGRMTRVAWTLVGVRALNAIAIRQLDTPFFEPRRWDCFACPPGTNLMLIRDDPDLTIILDDIGIGLLLLELLALIVVLSVRLWRATPPARRVLAPVFVPMVVVSLGVMAEKINILAADIAGLTAWTPDFVARLQLIHATTILALPLGILLGFRLEERRRARLADVVADDASRGSSLVARVRQSLGDPSADVVVGEQEPTGGPDRTVRPLVHGGRRVGWLVHDPAAGDDPRLLSGVTATAALAVSNEALARQLAASLANVRDSKARLMRASDDARRGVERDLSRGAKARLRKSLDDIAEAEAAADETLRPTLAELRAKLEATLDEIHALAKGLVPAALSERGLGAALDELASGSPVPVRVLAVPSAPLPPPVEAAVWFVVSEALANAAKHAHARAVTISATADGGKLRVEIADDGRGGADPEGGGLAGLAERVRELDGDLTIDSPPGEGTRVIVTFPVGGDVQATSSPSIAHVVRDGAP